MAKLPDNFVKPPAASRLTTGKTAAPKQARRVRKPVEAEAAVHLYSVLVRLSPEEQQALAAACDALAAVGETVTVEDMIKQVIARWITATRAMHGPLSPAPEPAVSVEPIRAQLRLLAEQPLRRWRAIGETLRRWTRAFGRP